jgi:ferritin-like metal-binding protein YciE
VAFLLPKQRPYYFRNKTEEAMKEEQLHELLYQAYETELGGVQVYTTALRCVQNEDLKEEWQEYLEQTENHVEIVRNVLEVFGLDPEKETPRITCECDGDGA